MSMLQLHSVDSRHPPIDLPEGVTVTLGRSPSTKITDKCCSRQHISLVADYKDRTVKLTQLGVNSARVQGKDVPKGESQILKYDETFFMVADSYEYKIGHKKKESKSQEKKRTIDEFFGLKGEAKRQKTSCDVEQLVEDEVQRKLNMLQNTKLVKSSVKEHKVPATSDNNHPGPALYKKSDAETGWIEYKDLLIYNPPGLHNSSKIAGFDMDSTLITTASGKTFAQDHNDWRILYPEIPGKLKALHREEFKIVIITNQLGIGKGKVSSKDFKVKIDNILTKFGVPIQVIAITKRGPNRKPNTGTWTFLQDKGNGGIRINMKESFYIGDAAGRPKDWAPKKKKDFSCTDRLFALNLGISFKTPEEFFMSQKPAKFNMPEFDPRSVENITRLSESPEDIDCNKQEVVVMVGYPASGKSFFSGKYLASKGYTWVNRDTMKTWQKCVMACKQALAAGKSVVVDNTNPDKISRKRYIDCAKSQGCDCRCFVSQVSMEHARHNNRFRELSGSEHDKVPDMVFYQYRKAFEEPSLDEGFSSILKVNFVPKFESQEMKKKYFLYTD